MTAEIRPRSKWEAVDLGLSLARVHLWTLWKAWLVTVLPICAVILGAFFQSPGWGAFLIWWLKPIWDRVALFPLSRNLFGEEPDTKATILVVPQQIRQNGLLIVMGIAFAVLGLLLHPDGNGGLVTFYWLSLIGCLFYRSSIYRSLVLPVHFLEGLRAAKYRVRVDLLTRRSSGTGLALTLICLMIEAGIFMSLFYFAELMVPPGAAWSFEVILIEFFEVGSEALPQWLVLTVTGAYVVAMSVTSWFYAGGGFGLYVNSRTWTEGWDIELAFKRLGQRLSLLVLGVGLFVMTPDLEAQTAKEQMEEILSDEAFDEKSYVQRTEVFDDDKRTDDSSRGPSSSAGLFAGVGQLLFWIIAFIVVGGLIWMIGQNLQAFSGGEAPEEGERKKVRTFSGMKIAPETLPDDVLAVAQKLWYEGRTREALALLYRGAISALVSRDLVELEESDTEMDCLRRLQASGVAESAYFERLTRSWMGIAYARKSPEESEMGELWNGWPFSGRNERRGA
ncbi:MAG: hypothetical protein ACON5H_01880 [Akkermansiaceae bacterium]